MCHDRSRLAVELWSLLGVAQAKKIDDKRDMFPVRLIPNLSGDYSDCPGPLEWVGNSYCDAGEHPL